MCKHLSGVFRCVDTRYNGVGTAKILSSAWDPEMPLCLWLDITAPFPHNIRLLTQGLIFPTVKMGLDHYCTVILQSCLKIATGLQL